MFRYVRQDTEGHSWPGGEKGKGEIGWSMRVRFYGEGLTPGPLECSFQRSVPEYAFRLKLSPCPCSRETRGCLTPKLADCGEHGRTEERRAPTLLV